MIQLFFNQRGAGKSKNLVKLANEEIEKLKKMRDKYVHIKNGMMSDLLTGKIRLV